MTFAVRFAAGVAGLGFAIAVATVCAAQIAPHRSGIERTQSGPDTGDGEAEGDPGAQQDRQLQPDHPDSGASRDGDEDAPTAKRPSPDGAEPPGCRYRQGPLELIV